MYRARILGEVNPDPPMPASGCGLAQSDAAACPKIVDFQE